MGAAAHPARRARLARPAGRTRRPPPGSQVIVMDIPRIVEEATRAATAAGVAAADPKIRSMVEKRIEQELAARQQGLNAMAEALTREAAPAGTGSNAPVGVEGRSVEVAVQKDGRVIGRANAMLNLDRTLTMILGFARRDQGEIPFAIDRTGALHTPEAADKTHLQSLGVERTALVAAAGTPRRTGDWIIVARTAPGGITFGIARPIGESLREIRRASVRNLGLGLLVIALAFLGIIPISHRMTQHLTALTSGVRQLAGGDFGARVLVKSKDEFGALAGAFNQMAEDLERHEAQAVGQERLRRELELSRLIQTEMLPRTSLRSGPAEIAGVSIPAREVGGDFFNYFVLPDGRLALLIGDVSGKGVSAALLMANIQATLRARLPHETDLAGLADKLDRELGQNTPGGVYLTLFLGILDMDGRVLRYVNAGHNPQFVIRAHDGIEPLSSTGMPIALYAGHGYTEARVELARRRPALLLYRRPRRDDERRRRHVRRRAPADPSRGGADARGRRGARAHRGTGGRVPGRDRAVRRRDDDGDADHGARDGGNTEESESHGNAEYSTYTEAFRCISTRRSSARRSRRRIGSSVSSARFRSYPCYSWYPCWAWPRTRTASRASSSSTMSRPSRRTSTSAVSGRCRTRCRPPAIRRSPAARSPASPSP